MQDLATRRSNRDRTEATRSQLIEAGRALFVEKGYAETGTPEIVAAAGLTRGALYHHFPDKQALFRAIVVEESRLIAGEIDAASPRSTPAREALIAGGRAFLSAMGERGRTRLLLLDGPAVLGRQELDSIDLEVGAARSLREGLAYAMRSGAIRPLPLDALTGLLSAAFDRAALALAAGAPVEDQFAVLSAMIEGLRADV